ncbi:MAG: hypothetical protein U0271_02165 [Polyangiaceae bacterium]
MSADAKANAQILFDRGLRLHESGNFELACPLFAESMRLDPGLGTLLWLSDCYEQLGKIASAWAGFTEAEQLAKQRGQAEREKKAHDRATALAPRLSMLRIVVAEEAKAIGIVVKRNGVVIGDASWDQLLPVDPGPQKLEAEAPGYKRWTFTIDIPLGPSESVQEIPMLEKAPIEKPAAPPSSVDGDAMRISGIAIGATGLASLLLGAGFGIHAVIAYNDALDTCINGDIHNCTDEGVSLQQSASRSALISTVSITIGSVAVAGGVLLYFLAPASAPSKPEPQKQAKGPTLDPSKVTVGVGPDGAYFGLGGAW